jgi:protein gp37
MSKENVVEWSQKPWNPITGCDPLSMGCENCYAKKIAAWCQRMGQNKYKNGFNLTLHPEALHEPCKRKKPTRILCCSMSDLFHKDVPLDYIQKVFQVICDNSQNMFMIVTKRTEILHKYHLELPWPDNLLQAVSVEHPKYKYRLKLLQETQAKHKVAFFEPLLEDLGELDLSGFGWAFVGGESGPGARGMKKGWVQNIKEQCEEQGCTFIFKQWGGPQREQRGCLLDGKRFDDIPAIGILDPN